MSESMREEFEAWVNTKTSVARSRDGDGYKDHHVQLMWITWQASRTALCVELPKIVNTEWACTSDECAAMRDAIRFCKQAIHAAGVKTK